MKNATVTENKPIKWGIAIKILTIVSFGLVLVAFCVQMLFFYVVGFFVNDLFLYILAAIPVLLFGLYVFKYYNRSKATWLIPVILLILGYFDCCTITIYGYYGYSRAIFTIIINIMLGIFAVICSFIGNRKLTEISISVYMIVCITRLVSGIRFCLLHTLWVYYLHIVVLYLTQIVLCVAMLLFVVKNDIPRVIRKRMVSNPEKDLRVLKEKYELGAISEEDYQAQRAEIINKL